MTNNHESRECHTCGQDLSACHWWLYIDDEEYSDADDEEFEPPRIYFCMPCVKESRASYPDEEGCGVVDGQECHWCELDSNCPAVDDADPDERANNHHDDDDDS